MFRRVFSSIAIVLVSALTVSAQIRSPYIKGTAAATAKRPYESYTVRLRNITTNTVQDQHIDAQGRFLWSNVPMAPYLVELVDPTNKVVCTEGPFDLRTTPYHDITIRCARVPAAWWLLTAAGAAGIAAGVVAVAPASPSR